jgi:hypothetical protein
MAHKVIVPPKKNYIPQFLKQRDINSYSFSSQIRPEGQPAARDHRIVAARTTQCQTAEPAGQPTARAGRTTGVGATGTLSTGPFVFPHFFRKSYEMQKNSVLDPDPQPAVHPKSQILAQWDVWIRVLKFKVRLMR